MAEKTDAELEAERGEAATAEAKAKAEKDKQGDDDVVPKSQFLAAIHSANQKYAVLEAKLNAVIEAGQKKADPPPKHYTRSELNAAVQANQITQEAADQVWDDQIRAEARSEAATVSTEIITRAQRKERVDSDISRYVALTPDVMVEGSETRDKVAKEYNFLVSLGDPKTPETELKAMRSALGPIDSLELARSGTSRHETHRETGDAGSGGGKPGGKKFEDTLTERERNHYQRLITNGVMKDWDEVKDEMKYANPKIRQKYGASTR